MSLSNKSRIAAHIFFTLVPFLTAMAVSQAEEAQRGIDTPRCKDAISEIVEQTNTTFERASPSGNNVFLQHPAARSLVLACAPYTPVNIFVAVGSAFPNAKYYALVASIGALLTGKSAASLEKAIRRCQLSALKSKDEQEELHLPGAQIDCQAFVRDGGSTAITVAPE